MTTPHVKYVFWWQMIGCGIAVSYDWSKFVDKWGTEIVDHFLVIFIQRFSPLSSRLTALLSHVILNEWLAFNSAFYFILICTEVVNSRALFGCIDMAGVTWNRAAISARFVYAIQPCTISRHCMQSRHIRRVHACLPVTCHLHIWQNDRDLLRATADTEIRVPK